MRKPLSILLTAGHAIDAAERVGGTLSIHVDRGDRVAVAILAQLGDGTPDQAEAAKHNVVTRYDFMRACLQKEANGGASAIRLSLSFRLLPQTPGDFTALRGLYASFYRFDFVDLPMTLASMAE